MTIAFDDGSNISFINATPTLPLTWRHEVGAGNDRLLVVCVQFEDKAKTISSVTYAGQAFNSANRVAAVGGTYIRNEIWWMINPPVGTANVIVTPSGATRAYAQGSSWTGVHQTTPTGTGVSAIDNTGPAASPITVTATSAAGEYVIDSAAQRISAATFTIGALQTLINGTSSTYLTSCASYEAGATSTVMSWVTNKTGPWVTVALPIKPSTTTSDPVSLSVSIAEVRVTPLRAAPSGFSPTGSVSENNQAGYEASGQFSKILVATPSYGEGAAYIFDDLYTLPSVAPGGKIAVTNLPTPNSPNGSLIVMSQDTLLSYPLPFNDEPAFVHGPALATAGGAAGAENFIPTYYPSAIDCGSAHKLSHVDIDVQDATANVDSVAYCYRWDETNAWSAVVRSKNSGFVSIPAPLGFNAGRVLHLAFSIHDSVATDPIGPSIRAITAYVEPTTMPARTGQQPPRTEPEES